MPEFEMTLTSTVENQSWLDLMQDIQTLGDSEIARFEISQALHVKECKDAMSPLTFSTPFLDSHSEELERLYRRILSRDAPMWTMDYKSNPYPDAQRWAYFSSIRQLAEIMTADARRRLSLGDQAGAQEEMRAISRLTENLQNCTDSYALVTGISIQLLARAVQVHLPEEPEPWVDFAAKVKVLRENCRQAIQLVPYNI